MITSFTIRKEIECKTTSIAKSQVDSLAELEEKKDTFGQINIPDFKYGREDNFVWYEADYVKGRIIKPKDMKTIVWKECVLREDSFTLSNYGCPNFIWCKETHRLYYIDLNDCRHMSIEERMEFWNKEREIDRRAGY